MADQEADLAELQRKLESMRPKYPEVTFKSFLEETPPDTYVYVVDLLAGSDVHHIAVPELTLFCDSDRCVGPRVFRVESSPFISNASWRYDILTFHCRNCGTRAYRFAISFLLSRPPTSSATGLGTFHKLGQVPAFGPTTPARLVSLIGPDKELFLQGRRAENRGMGIGAFAYYRRVVENQKNRIIFEISKVAKVIGSTPETDALFTAAMNETRFSESINMVKAVIPQTLLINGQNPLTLLHTALSKGLHNADMSDAHCLALAQSIRTILVELAERSSEALKNDKEIQSALSVLMAVPSSQKAG